MLLHNYQFVPMASWWDPPQPFYKRKNPNKIKIANVRKLEQIFSRNSQQTLKKLRRTYQETLKNLCFPCLSPKADDPRREDDSLSLTVTGEGFSDTFVGGGRGVMVGCWCGPNLYTWYSTNCWHGVHGIHVGKNWPELTGYPAGDTHLQVGNPFWNKSKNGTQTVTKPKLGTPLKNLLSSLHACSAKAVLLF